MRPWFSERTSAVDCTPNRHKGNCNHRGTDPRRSETQSGPQQQWHKRIKQCRRAAPSRIGESEMSQNSQHNEQCDCFQVISTWSLGPSWNFSGPTQNSRHQSEESKRFRKESHLPTCPIVATGGQRTEERSNEWSKKRRVD